MTTAIRDAVSPDPRATLPALKPGQMLDTLPDRLALARQQHMTHAGFLGLVLAGEVTRREARSASLRARAAGPEAGMRPDTRDATAAVRHDQQPWNELASLRFPDAPHGALLPGPVGAGQTHLACAPGHIAIRRRRGVHMARAGKLFKRLRAARLDNTQDYQMRRLATVEPLIIDDLALQPLDAASTTDFHELRAARHQKAATIVTSNRTPDQWPAMTAGPLLAQSAVDRLVPTSHELIIEGPSYRQHQKPSTSGHPAGPPVDDEKGHPA